MVGARNPVQTMAKVISRLIWIVETKGIKWNIFPGNAIFKELFSNFSLGLPVTKTWVVLLNKKCFQKQSPGGCSVKKSALKIFAKFTGKNLCRSLFFKRVAFIKKETPIQMLSFDFCQTFKNTFFTEHLPRLPMCFARCKLFF